MGQGGCGTQAPTGREAQRRGEEYLELGHDSLSLAAFHLVLAAGRLILRLQSSRQALTAWPLCAGVNLYTRPLFPALFMGCRTTAQGGRPAGARRGGGSREPRAAHPPLCLLWVISPSSTHCIRKGKNYSNSIRGIWKHGAGCREITAQAITSDYGSLGQAGEQREELWSGQPGLCLSPTATSQGLG